MAIKPSARYAGKIDTSDPTGYPLGKAQNITVAGDGTGTPWEEAILNDLFGFQQELLSKAGVVIAGSGTPDKVGASEYFDAIRATCGYPGMIQPLALNVDPSTLGIRMLIMDGSGILVANYSDLVTATYIGDSDNPTADAFYRADDAAGTARNTAGAYFILPDTSGRFLRGADPGGSFDPDGASRLIGSNQTDALQKHNHVIQNDIDAVYSTQGSVGTDGVSITAMLPTGSKSGAKFQASAANVGDAISGFLNISGVGRVAIETRPLNMQVKWGIWY